MSPSVKRFLLGYFVAYVVLCAVGIVAFKSPDFSSEFKRTHGAELGRFHKILKTPAYKAYHERPHLVKPDEALKADIEFVEEFEATPAFKAEEHRKALYVLYFKWMSSAMFVLLVVRFASKPLCNYLDGQIAEIRRNLDEAEQARTQAAAKKAEALKQLETFPALAEEVRRQSEKDVAAALKQVNEEGALAEHQLSVEMEDRKRDECNQAVATIRKELVECALDEVEKMHRTDPALKDLTPCVVHFEQVLEQIT